MNRPFDDDRVIFDLAEPQHGVVSSRQLRAAGVRRGAVTRRLRAGLMQRVHHGVYRVGPITAPYAREMAAVLACAGCVVISHRSAAGVWQIMLLQSHTEPVEVIAMGTDHGRRRRIRARRVRTLRPDETTMLHGLPVTTPARTLMDLAAVAGGRELERAVAEAYARRLTTREALVRLLGRHAGQPGVRQLRALVESEPPVRTRSEAEELFLGHVRRVELPAPEVNVRVCGHEVDFYWRSHRFVVEVDGFAFHSSSDRFEGDRRRDAALAAEGIGVMRVTWRQLTDDPGIMLVRLAQALAVAGTTLRRGPAAAVAG